MSTEIIDGPQFTDEQWEERQIRGVKADDNLRRCKAFCHWHPGSVVDGLHFKMRLHPCRVQGCMKAFLAKDIQEHRDLEHFYDLHCETCNGTYGSIGNMGNGTCRCKRK